MTTGRSSSAEAELIALGKTIVTKRLESLGCTVEAPSSRIGGKLDVRTPSGRSIEVLVSTQRLGGYVFWTKRRLQPASNRFAAIVLLADAVEPDVYLVPNIAWRNASPPSRTVTTSASAASPSTASRSPAHLSPRFSVTPGTRTRARLVFARPPCRHTQTRRSPYGAGAASKRAP
jgi:hypothetical protein